MNLAVILLAAVLPTVTVDSFTVSDSGIATIDYTLGNGPAVVTVDVETNGPSGWASIGTANIYPANLKFGPSGDANRLVQSGSRSIRWRVNRTWPNQSADIRAVLTAWPADDTPDYMVVDLNDGVAAADRVRYYASSNSLPGGGLFAIDDYRTTKLVMKKVLAKGVTWTMGNASNFGRIVEREASHPVTLSNNYYLGVFPLTQKQCNMINGAAVDADFFPIDGDMRIRDRIFFHTWAPMARGSTPYPGAPDSGSLLGKLRKMTEGVVDDWDLPSEAQWEYAAKAGHGEAYWGDDTPIMIGSTNYNYDVTVPGRFRYNQADQSWCNSQADWLAKNAEQPTSNGTPVAGSYRPNAWGFYDMAGGVFEWCLDWFQENIVAYGGAVNANGEYRLDGSTPYDNQHVKRGGSWRNGASACRPSYRDFSNPTYLGDCFETGMRVSCRAGLK